jgi:hypothetical protein
MKKIFFATAFLALAIAQSQAQTPAAVSTQKDAPAVKATPAKPAPQATMKPAPKVAPASVATGKPAMHKAGKHSKKAAAAVKENKAPAKPMATGTDEKK